MTEGMLAIFRKIVLFLFLIMVQAEPASSFDGIYPPGYWDEGYCVAIADWQYNHQKSGFPQFTSCVPINIEKARSMGITKIYGNLQISSNNEPFFYFRDTINRYY